MEWYGSFPMRGDNAMLGPLQFENEALDSYRVSAFFSHLGWLADSVSRGGNAIRKPPWCEVGGT